MGVEKTKGWWWDVACTTYVERIAVGMTVFMI